MADYAELIKTLRYCNEYDNCGSRCPRFESNGDGDCVDGLMKDAADAIEELLAKVPKNGKWIAERDGSIVELSKNGFVGDSCHCSVCNEHLDGSEEYAVKGIFCPSCGAIMNM